MADLISPGVDIRVIEEELGATVGPGTVPLIFIATKQNKTTEAGTVALGTLPENAGKLDLITSQRELLQKYGIPYFREVDGTVVQADEVNEYGLHAAYSYLGLANRCYVVRANLDLDQLLPTEETPRGEPENGTYWFNFTDSKFGVFTANGNEISGLAWNEATVAKTTSADIDTVTGIPLDTFGQNGDFAVVPQFSDNRIYEKLDGSWYVIGQSTWKAEKPTVAVASNGDPEATAAVVNIIINGTTVAIADTTTATAVASAINSASITNITASVVSNALTITNTAGGSISLSSGGSALEFYGFKESYAGASLTYATHINVPNGERVGSIWIKTTTPNNGADYDINRYNATIGGFESIDAPFFASDSDADSSFGATKNIGTLYVQYNSAGTTNDPVATHVIKRWSGTAWEELTYEVTAIAPTTDPVEGTLWFNAALEADILVNTGNQWRGYRNVYPGTDVNGPQVTSKMPTTQSTGAPLVNYDLWIKSDEVLGYPEIYRYLNGSWELVDNTDKTTPFGVVFGDIREDSGPNGPWIRGGVRATATAKLKAVSAFIAEPGEGYDDGTYTVTVNGGTASTATSLEVIVVNGQVDSVSVTTAGSYSALPSGGVNVTVTGIDGSPTTTASFNISWGLESVVVATGGSGYTTNPIISIVGGGGSGATALTTITTGAVTSVTVTSAGSGYTSIPTVFINTPFGRPESDSIADMAVSDWNDPVELDVLNPQLFPAGMILFNTRRSTNNVKVWRGEFFDGVTEYTVGNFLSDTYELSNPGAKDAAITYLQGKPARWVTFSGNDLQGVGLFGRFAQRICVVRAIAAEIIGNQDIRSEFINFNLTAAPGYVEVYDELITLNVDRRETAFIVADVPVDLTPSATNIQTWAQNLNNVASNGRDGRTNRYDYAAMYYPWALSTNVDGKEIVVPSSTIALRTYGYNDSVAYPWYPPAGTRRGVISNASSVGYVNLETRQYNPVVLNPGQRDTLYENDINPLALIPNRGLLVYGDKTLSPNDGSALSRVNVARLVVYLRTVLPNALAPFLFELNTERTRSAAQQVTTAILTDLLGKEAITDFVVSLEGNTPDAIDRNELHVDVAIAPTKSINFIIVPIRIKRTGTV